ncbi:MAG TPA: SOS response-associated peptidase [Burkholderiales bacterium]|nr:SOS response-associated peptidase [Burkholderiales bacterium]
MCGRYGRFSRKERIEQALGFPIQGGDGLVPRYNICPGLPDWAIQHETSAARFELLEWGLLPSWTKNRKTAHRPINARAETVAAKPMFRDLLRTQRCVLPADGYYEWRTTSSGKVPFWFALKSKEPFFLAGLWDTWHAGKADAVSSYILMTTEPNELAATVHDRMPVLLHARDVQRWLDPAINDAEAIADLLGPYPADEMAAHPVSRSVSDPRSEGAELIKPDDSARELWG